MEVGGDEVGAEGNRVVVTVLGHDRVGIIAGLTEILARNSVNILDITQTILQDVFAMIMLVDMGTGTVDLKSLQEQLDLKGQEIGVKVTAVHEDVFRFMHRL